MGKKQEKNTYVEDLNYTPSKTASEVKIDEEEVLNESLKDDPEYKEYLKLKEKFAPVENQQKSNPILKIILRVFISILVVYVILFVIGFIMGENGYKPQQLDWNVVTNQLNGGDDDSSNFSELEKVTDLEKVENTSETS